MVDGLDVAGFVDCLMALGGGSTLKLRILHYDACRCSDMNNVHAVDAQDMETFVSRLLGEPAPGPVYSPILDSEGNPLVP